MSLLLKYKKRKEKTFLRNKAGFFHGNSKFRTVIYFERLFPDNGFLFNFNDVTDGTERADESRTHLGFLWLDSLFNPVLFISQRFI